MSTVISHGRIIHKRVDVAYRLLMGVRAEAVSLGRTIEARWLATQAARMIDDARMSGTTFEHPLHRAWCEMDDRRREIARTRLRDPLVDIGLELWLFPRDQDTLVIVRSEQPGLIDWFDRLDFVDDHSWWDNADRPDDVSVKAWSVRRRDWKAMLPSGSTPDEKCLALTMCSPNRMPPDPEAVLGEIPPLATRIADMAEERHIMKRIGMLRKNHDSVTDPGEVMRLYGEARRIAEADPDGRALFRHHAEERLTEITMKDLVG